MLNKKDPLINAVQQVMQQSNAEREATRIVNEAFGVEDRKALPHEYQAQWNAEYQQVLSESADLAALAPPHHKVTKKDVLVGRGVLEKHPTKPGKHILAKEEEQIDERKLNPYAVGMAVVKKSTGDEPPMKKKNIVKAHEIAKKIMKKSMDESAGAPGGMVDYMQKKAKREAAQKASQNKGSDPTNTSGGMRAGAVASRGSDPTNTDSGQRAGAAQPKPPKPKLKPVAAAAKSTNTATPPATKKVKKVRPADIGSGGKQERGSSLGVTTGTTTGTTATNRPLSKAMRDNPVASFRKAPKATAGAALRNPGAARNALKDKGITRAGVAKGINNARSGKSSFGGGNRAGRGGEGRGGRGSLKEQIQNIIAEKAAGGMVAQQQAKQNQQQSGVRVAQNKGSDPTNTSGGMRAGVVGSKFGERPATNAQLTAQAKARQGFGAPAGGNYQSAQAKAAPALDPTRKANLDQPATKSPMAMAQNRQDLAKSVQAGRAGTNTTLNRAPASSGVSGNPMGDVNPGQEYSTPTSPQSQAQSNMTPTVKTRPDLPVARKKAEPIKVSDTEVMNDPKFKKALSNVGGSQAAKKIQVGQRVAGLGRMNKGDTIMSRVRTDIAARKNVGRES